MACSSASICVQVQLEHEAVMRVDAPAQRLDAARRDRLSADARARRSQAGAGSSSPAMIASSIARPLLPEDVAEHAGDLEVGVLEHLLDAQRHAGHYSRTSCLRVRVRSRSSWIATGGTKLARIRPCASRSAIHVASLTSVLRPGTLRMWVGVGQHQLELAFQHVPHRLPVHARGFHRHVRAPRLAQPVGQREQPRGRGLEGAYLMRWRARRRRCERRPRRCPCARRAPRIADRSTSMIDLPRVRRRRGIPVVEI